MVLVAIFEHAENVFGVGGCGSLWDTIQGFDAGRSDTGTAVGDAVGGSRELSGESRVYRGDNGFGDAVGGAADNLLHANSGGDEVNMVGDILGEVVGVGSEELRRSAKVLKNAVLCVEQRLQRAHGGFEVEPAAGLGGCDGGGRDAGLHKPRLHGLERVLAGSEYVGDLVLCVVLTVLGGPGLGNLHEEGLTFVQVALFEGDADGDDGIESGARTLNHGGVDVTLLVLDLVRR